MGPKFLGGVCHPVEVVADNVMGAWFVRPNGRKSLAAAFLASIVAVDLVVGPGSASAEPAATDPATTTTAPEPSTESAPVEPSVVPTPPAEPAEPGHDAPESSTPPSEAPGAPEPSAAAAAVGAAGQPAGGRRFMLNRQVVVYGGTPGGVSAAIAAAEHGMRVTLVTEGSTVGGLMSNGISATDIGSPIAVQGVARRFFDEVRTFYRDPSTWRVEPRIAERILRRMLREARVDVVYHSPIRAARVKNRRVTCGLFRRVDLCAQTFIDASYTGDLMAAAHVSTRLGMADFRAYPQETLPARRNWFQLLTVPADEASAAAAAFDANPFIAVQDVLESYEVAHQHGTPSITYRLCVTKTAGKKTALRPGPHYGSLVPSFRYMAARLRDEVVVKSNGTLLSDAFHLAAIPGGKYDLNAGRLSFTNLPTPPGYFALRTDRAAANRLVRDYVQSWFYFVQRDRSVPASIRRAFAGFGLCADEFTDNGNWPRQPYVREGRRLVGRSTMTEQDIFTHREKAASVALASYNLDSKLSQFVFSGDTLYRDLGVHSTAPVYEIPYSAMLPKAGGVLNLVVPVGLSASPTAFGSIRMEPQWMALGEAAGVAAAIAGKTGAAVSAVPVDRIQGALRYRGVLYKARDACAKTPSVFRAAGGYTVFCTVLPVAPRILE